MKTTYSRRRLSLRLSEKEILIISVLFLALVLIPLFVLSRYSIPAADDFSFSCETHEAIRNGEGIPGVVSGAAEKTAKVYNTWQGTFSAIFLMALQPAIWGFEYYQITAYLMLFSLIGSVFFLCIRVFSGLFGVKKSLSGIIASIVCLAFTQLLPSANQGFYWYNSAVYYTFTYALCLTALSVITGYIVFGGNWRIWILGVLSVIIGGSNFVTALISTVGIVLLILFLLFKKNGKWKSFLIPAALLCISFLISILAPGNEGRQAIFLEHPGAVRSIFLSFTFCAKNLKDWADLRFLAIVFLLFPFIKKAVHTSENCSFACPGLFSFFSFCILSAMFTPQIYAMGTDGPDRLKNIIYFSFILLTLFNLFWWCGWLNRKYTLFSGSKNCTSVLNMLPYLSVSVLCLAVSILVFHNPLSSVIAFRELQSGEAKAFYAEAVERQIVLEDESVPDCEFAPYENVPLLLYFTDMTDDPDYYENQDACTYYSKTSIIVK